LSNDFIHLDAVIRRVFPDSDLQSISESESYDLRRHYANLPGHYLDFLREIGWGRLGQMNFMFYSGPVEADEIFDPTTAKALSHILFLGDNFAGWELGFDTSDQWRLVGVDSASPHPVPEGSTTLAEFVTARVANEKAC